MICIYENAQAVNLNKYYLISLSQQLGYLVFLGGYETRQCQWAAAAPLGPNEHTTTAAVHAGITSSQHSHMRASNFSNQWETRYEVNALKIIYDRFLLPNAQDIIETVRLLGRLSMVRSNLKKIFFLFRSKALGHITSKNLNNMICIWYENAQAVNLNKYYLISLSQQLGYLVLRAW